jgi:hypothetical protein
MTEESVLALIAASPRNGVGPVGSVIAWPASEPSVPNGWHVCDGSDLKADEYPELTRILGATYGAVGPNQVRLPDFRGYFLRGRDKSPGQDQGSLELGQPEDWATALPTGSGHVPIFSGINSEKMFTKMGYLQFKSGEGSVVGGIIASEKDASEVQNWQHSHPLSGGDKETRPKNYAVHWLIRVR